MNKGFNFFPVSTEYILRKIESEKRNIENQKGDVANLKGDIADIRERKSRRTDHYRTILKSASKSNKQNIRDRKSQEWESFARKIDQKKENIQKCKDKIKRIKEKIKGLREDLKIQKQRDRKNKKR